MKSAEAVDVVPKRVGWRRRQRAGRLGQQLLHLLLRQHRGHRGLPGVAIRVSRDPGQLRERADANGDDGGGHQHFEQ